MAVFVVLARQLMCDAGAQVQIDSTPCTTVVRFADEPLEAPRMSEQDKY